MYYVKSSRGVHGPYSRSQIEKMIDNGRIKPHYRIRIRGGKWVDFDTFIAEPKQNITDAINRQIDWFVSFDHLYTVSFITTLWRACIVAWMMSIVSSPFLISWIIKDNHVIATLIMAAVISAMLTVILLGVRIVFEYLIVIFKIYEQMTKTKGDRG